MYGDGGCCAEAAGARMSASDDSLQGFALRCSEAGAPCRDAVGQYELSTAVLGGGEHVLVEVYFLD